LLSASLIDLFQGQFNASSPTVVSVEDQETTPEIVQLSSVEEELDASKLSIPEEVVVPGVSIRSISLGVTSWRTDDTEDVVLDTRLLPSGRLHPSVSTLTRTKPADSSSVSTPKEPLVSPQLLTVTRKLQ